jgi:hypothetical protein
MILPSKHVSQDRALLTVGLRVLKCLDEPRTVSAVWEDIPRTLSNDHNAPPSLSYDTFVLALVLLFSTSAIDLNEGLLTRRAS